MDTIPSHSQSQSGSLATTSLSLVVNISSSTRNDEAQSTQCVTEVLLHSANVLPHPILNYLFEADYLAPGIAKFFLGHSHHFFPHLMTDAQTMLPN